MNTHGSRYLTTLLIKYFNDLPGVQRAERNRNEVTFFYVGDVLCIHLGSKYADFQEKTSRRFLGKSSKLFIVVTQLRGTFYNKSTFFSSAGGQRTAKRNISHL